MQTTLSKLRVKKDMEMGGRGLTEKKGSQERWEGIRGHNEGCVSTTHCMSVWVYFVYMYEIDKKNYATSLKAKQRSLREAYERVNIM